MTEDEKAVLVIEELSAPIFSVQTAYFVQRFVDSLNSAKSFCSIVASSK